MFQPVQLHLALHELTAVAIVSGEVMMRCSYGTDLHVCERAIEEAVEEYPGLHQEVLFIGEIQNWNEFALRNRAYGSFVVHLDGSTCSRFYGNLEALEHFQRLAERCFIAMQNLRTHEEFADRLPHDLLLQPPVGHEWLAWLDIVRRFSDFFCTENLRTRPRLWGHSKSYDVDEWEALLQVHESLTEEGDSYYPHPMCLSFPCDVLLSSLYAVQYCLRQPDSVRVHDPIADLSKKTQDDVTGHVCNVVGIIDVMSSNCKVAKASEWLHPQSDPVPTELYSQGYAEGTQQAFCKALGLADERTLHIHGRSGRIWAQSISRYKVGIWFQHRIDWSRIETAGYGLEIAEKADVQFR